MALTEIPIELSSTPGIVDNSNATAITIDSSENVGIGTDSPPNKFVVAEGTNQHGIELSPGTTSYIQAYDRATSDYGDLKIDAQTIAFGTDNGTERFRIMSSGDARFTLGADAVGSFQDDVGEVGSGNFCLQVANSAQSALKPLGFRAEDIRFATSAGERMRLDASGNLLVGESANFIATSTTATGLAVSQDGRFTLSRSGIPMNVGRLGSDGSLIDFWRQGATVGSIGTEGGDLAIGNDDAGIQFVNGTEHFRPFNMTANAATDALMDIGSSTKRFKDLYLSGNAYADNLIGTNDGDTFIAMTGSNVMRFFTGNSEAARFDASGNLLVGLTSISDATSRTYGNAFSGTSANPNWKSWGSGSHTHAQFRNGTSAVGSITSTSSATAYNTSSDQRLKDNIVDAPSASDDIDAIQVRSFDWKADGSHQKYGMVAQELQTVAPEAVSAPENPEEMMGVDYSKLVPMLVKEIQSLRARVAQLES